MTIFLDADSCPREARELVLRSAGKRSIPLIFAANRPIPGIEGRAVMEVCPPGENSADNRIVSLAQGGDLVITRDLPLAERLVEGGIMVIDDRGRVYTAENIKEKRSMRDFMVGLAQSGLGVERKSSYGKRELKAFADSLDTLLTRLSRN